MKVVILAGGHGTRLGEETTIRPKPMVELAGKPMLWHIMKYYSSFGLTEFVICLGYKGYMIKEYFSNYFLHTSDVTIDLRSNATIVHNSSSEPWIITLVETGESTMTGGRLRRIRHHLGDEDFCMTYGDGLSDVDLAALIEFHREHGRLATVTAVSPAARFGAMVLDAWRVTRFEEKPQDPNDYINGGFFVLSPKVLDLLEGDDTVWEREPMANLAKSGELCAYRHQGFWHPMDMLRDKLHLEELWNQRGGPVEAVVTGALPDAAFWQGRRVFLTGHTGFKGTWLGLWLRRLGAQVTGFSDGTLPGRSLFADLSPVDHVVDRRGDVRNLDAVRNALAEARPDVVMHLAAQSLVRRSYDTPVETFATNVMGTAHVLEAARGLGRPCTVLVVTSDKCYENREWFWGYRETEPMGGHDPYSASKGCAELVASAFARSFGPSDGLYVVSARAGNVIGGGDWAPDRLIPDLVRGMREGRSVPIRNPDSVRPWQHVLEPLCGYLLLCERGAEAGITGQGWNFGPEARAEQPVRRVADTLCRLWGRPEAWHHAGDPQAQHEAGLLRLDSAKANRLLGWQPRWGLEQALAASVAVYRSSLKGAGLRQLLDGQIAEYAGAA